MRKTKTKKQKKEIYTVSDWLRISRYYNTNYDLKKLSKYSKNKLLRKIDKLKNKLGYIVIKPRKKYIDLSSYYSNPDNYFNDLFFFINSMKQTLMNKITEEDYITYMYDNDNNIYHMSLIHFVFVVHIYQQY